MLKIKSGPVYLFFLVFLFLLLRAGLYYIPSADLWWQLAAGQYIYFSKAPLLKEIFSFTAPQLPWLNHEWLAELVFFAVYQFKALAGLHIFKIFLLALAFFFILKTARLKGAGWLSVFLAGSLALLFSQGKLFFDLRPYLFTYLLGAVFYFLLEKAKSSGKSGWLFPLPLLMILWVNLHGAFLVGILLIFAYGLEAVGQRVKKAQAAFLSLGLVLILTLLATLLNPFKAQVWQILMGSKEVTYFLNEWEAPRLLGEYFPFLLYFLLVGLGFALNPRRGISEGLMLLIFGGLSLTAIRHIPLFCLFSVPVLAGFFQQMGERAAFIFKSRFLVFLKPIPVLAGIILLTGYSVFFFRGFSLSALSLEWEMFPPAGVSFLKANPALKQFKLFNPYEWGGYLIFKLAPDYPVFIDGRVNTVYPEELYFDALRVMFGKSGWEKILDRYKIDLVLVNLLQLSYGQKLSVKLAQSPHWREIYRDAVCAVWLRDSALLALKEKGISLLYPPSPYALFDRGVEAVKKGENQKGGQLFGQALCLYPRCAPALVNLAFVLLAGGEEEKGLKLLKEALLIDPKVHSAHFNLGIYYESKGKLKPAVSEFKKELKLNPDFAPARAALEELGK